MLKVSSSVGGCSVGVTSKVRLQWGSSALGLRVRSEMSEFRALRQD